MPLDLALESAISDRMNMLLNLCMLDFACTSCLIDILTILLLLVITYEGSHVLMHLRSQDRILYIHVFY